MNGGSVSMLSAGEEALARVLWETTDLTASEIAARFSEQMTKHVIIGVANRRGWKPRTKGKPPRTLFERLAELHEAFNKAAGLPPGTGYRPPSCGGKVTPSP